MLSGTTPVSAVAGVATFSNLSINLAGTGYILTSSSTGVGSANTTTFNIASLTLAGYWPLDDASGTTTADLSSNGDTGTITGTPSWTSGQVNGALSFDGSTNYVSMGTPTALKLGSSSFTVMSWFKTTQTTMGRMVNTGVIGYSAGFDLTVNVAYTCNAGCVGAELGGGSQGTTVSFGTTATTFNNNVWHQAAMVIDQSAKTAQLYVDGVVQPLSLQGSTCGTLVGGTAVNITACSSANATSADPFTLGAYHSGSTTSYPFAGSLDEVRVYNSALNSSQILNQYAIDTTPTLAGYWPFSEDSGTTTADLSGHGSTGTITGAGWTEGEINSGLSFNGTSNYVSMGTPTALEVNNTSFSISSWFKSTSTSVGRMVSSGLSTWNSGFYLSLNSSSCATGCVSGDLGADGTQTNTVLFATTTTFNDGNWHQAVMVVDQTAKTAQIYVDGVAQPLSKTFCGTVVSGTTVNFSTCSFANTYSTTEPFTIGAYKGTGGTFLDFAGTLDEVRVYNGALSSTQVQILYTNDINALSVSAPDTTFSGTPGSMATYNLPIALSYQLVPAPGWSLTITSTTLTSGGNTLPTNASSITSVTGVCTSSGTCLGGVGGNTLTNTISGFPMTLPAAGTAPTAVKFFGTAVGTGTGVYTVTPSITVTIPGSARTGAYTSVITLLAASGP